MGWYEWFYLADAIVNTGLALAVIHLPLTVDSGVAAHAGTCVPTLTRVGAYPAIPARLVVCAEVQV